jgi:hypothetical protein
MDLNRFTDQDLKAELQRREDDRKISETAARRHRFQMLMKHRDVLLEFVPHGRTSCSDQDIRNGLGSAEYGARCTRCALLELNEHDYFSYDAELSLTFRPVDQE